MSAFLCAHLCPSLPLSMMLFNSSHFLCCSVASFGASTTLPKNSSSLNNISPTLSIICIKCWNLHQMKNNIGYKGNTNKTSIIIFLKIKNSQRWYFDWDFCDVVVVHFIFDIHFVVAVVVAFVDILHFCCCPSHCFSTSSLTLPWTIVGVCTPHFILSAQPTAKWFVTLSIFQPFRYLVAASATGLSGHILPTGVLYITLFHQHFNLRLSRIF